MRTATRMAALAALLTLPAGGALAQDPGEVIGSLTDEETQKVAKFGRGVGQAYTCAGEDEKVEMLEDIRMIFNFVSQDMGTDAAFLYATTVGYGSGEEGGDFDCAERLEQWADVRGQFGLTEDGE